jgi:hypothetical protein
MERIEIALGAMAVSGPRDLHAYLRQPGPDIKLATASEIESAIGAILADDPNNPARLRFSNLLRSWDNAKDAAWIAATPRNTVARRQRIHQLLKSDEALQGKIDATLPFYALEEPLVIAKEHRDWYKPRNGERDYYWSSYVQYLREKRSWEDASILNLDNSTRAIVECLADPEGKEAYAARGLVMGYVQSGKTANFTGVVARAADAGYRLVVVLAGTWNILRNQTQRRLDKELLGKELLQNDESYAHNLPSDWNEFLEHGAEPAELGHFTWQRLTRPDIDFRRLKSAIDNLEFEKVNKARPIYASENLHALPVKLLVVKKHSGILGNLVKDLKLIRTRLTDLPALFVDDESDQAGINTVDPRKTVEAGEERSKTNLRIVELLELFPRGQYVGYTATPYANALIDPDDPKDLFPKDFIVSLDRPKGYMGVADFFDPNVAFEDLEQEDFSEPEIAYIRRVESQIGEDDEDLKKALRSYVLAGALKIFRHASDPGRYRKEFIKHHTMLVHTSPRKGEHASLVERLETLWNQCAFNGPKGLLALEKLWNEDYKKVSGAIGNELIPIKFHELHSSLSEAISRIERGTKIFLVLNSDSADAPDFGAAPVWKVIVGGNKLSRGYTIEGLTVSYYRRVAGTGDTLMQMGRWFGFRPGYRDLVRVFLGVREGRGGKSDLVSLFKSVCRMEERFRDEVKRYVRRPGAKKITPRDIPPLISVSGGLPPTASNKMFNAQLANKNFGGQRSMLTLTAAEPDSLKGNLKVAEVLLAGGTGHGTVTLGGISSRTGKSFEFTGVCCSVSNQSLVAFLRTYRWLESEYSPSARPADTNLQIEFLEEQDHGISSWLVIAPQRKISFGDPVNFKKVGLLTVKERQRVEGRGFQVFGEPTHRLVGEYLAGITTGKTTLQSPNSEVTKLKKANCGVCLLYPVRPEEKDLVSVGFELLFPPNDIPFDLNFTVRTKADKESAIVDRTE